MKKLLPLLVVMQLFLVNLHAQTFVVDTILNNGNKNNRINLVFLAEGYTSSEQTQFIADVNTIVTKFFITAPLSEYKPFFNVYAVRVVSSQSGTKHPNTAGDCATASPAVPSLNPTTYFGSTFDYGGTHRLLYSNNSSTINNVLQTNAPWFDKALMIINTPYYGGSGGAYAMGSTHPSSAEIMIHEFGHSFAGLADEYGGSSCSGQEKPNVTQETNPTLIKWKNWIEPGTALPTPAYTNCGNNGLYNGANYCNNGWYRPQCDCKMRTLGQPFCDVCQQEFIVKIMQYVNLIDAYTPGNGTALSLTSGITQQFTSQVLANIPNTIKVQWKLDNNVVANNVTNYSLNTTGLSIGVHTLTLSAWDTTSMARTTLPTFTTTWNINVTSSSGTPTLSAFSPVCSNANSFTLTGGSPTGGTYSGNGVTNGTFNPSTAGAGIHTITYTYNSLSVSQTISVTATPVMTGNSTASLCSGSTTTLTVGGATSYSWTPTTALSATTGASVSANPTTSITYTITGTSSGCTANKIVTVTVIALPNVLTSGNATVCNGNSTNITASGATTYTWAPSVGLNITTGTAVIATPPTTTIYSVTGTANGCSKNVPLTVSVNPLPQLTGASSASVCAASSIGLTVSGSTTYSWLPVTGLNVTTGATVVASPTSNTTYTVTGVLNGCINTKLIAVTVNTLPTISVSPSQLICAGSNTTLTAAGATSYTWSPATGLNLSSGNNVTATPTSNITYTVTGTQNGCNNTATVSVQVTSLPVVNISATSTNICAGNTSSLTASGATTYTWTPALTLNASTGNTVTASPSQTTTYTVTGNTNGCSATSTKIIQVNALPTLTTSGSTTMCTGSSATLTTNGVSCCLTW